jgi:hypothetical protein
MRASTRNRICNLELRGEYDDLAEGARTNVLTDDTDSTNSNPPPNPDDPPMDNQEVGPSLNSPLQITWVNLEALPQITRVTLGTQGQGNEQDSGFHQMLERLKGRLDDDVIIKQELDWQQDVKTDQTKASAFKEKARTLQSFAAFLIIRPQSAYLTCIHSAHVYYSSAAAPSELDGKLIGFFGDRTSSRILILIKLSLVATFDWKQLNAVDNPEGMQEYYNDNATGRLWAPAKHEHRDPFTVPRMLVLPTFGFKIMHLLGTKVMPHELRAAIEHHIASDTTKLVNNDS